MRKKAGNRDVNHIWDLGVLFSHDDDPGIEKNRLEIMEKSHAFIDKWKGRRDYLTDPLIMNQALDEYEQWKRHYGIDGNAGYYFWLRTQQDLNDPALRARNNKMEEFSRKVENDMQFFTLRIAKIPPRLQKKFLDYPGLKTYRHFLERIFAEARFMLSEPEEKIMNLKATTSHANWVRMTSAFLAKEERPILLESGRKEKQNLNVILSQMNNRQKKLRDSAARAFNNILSLHAETAEAELNSVLENKKTDDEIRGFTRPDQSRHISDDIESGVVDSLLSSVSRRFPISSRYYTLKARLLGVKRLRYHERNIEYGSIEKKYSYEESQRLILRVFRNLDDEFAAIYERFIQNRQIDVYPKKGRSGGAFCVHHLISQPTFILLNHTDRFQDVLTLAHELGHGINNELIRVKQNALDFGTPTTTAEVASTFMEDFVLQEILKKSDDETRLAILMTKLNDDISTIFRQVACYKFEQELHAEFRQKGYLPKEEIGALFMRHMSAYMGDSVEQSKGSENWWIYWSHIRYFFYVYSYASGLLISKSLQNSVKKSPAFIGSVKEFLAAGFSDSPENIFRKMGVEITENTFWEKGLDEVETLLDETISLAKRLGKL